MVVKFKRGIPTTLVLRLPAVTVESGGGPLISVGRVPSLTKSCQPQISLDLRHRRERKRLSKVPKVGCLFLLVDDSEGRQDWVGTGGSGWKGCLGPGREVWRSAGVAGRVPGLGWMDPGEYAERLSVGVKDPVEDWFDSVRK